MAVNLCIFPIFLPVFSLVTVLNVKLNKYADKKKMVLLLSYDFI